MRGANRLEKQDLWSRLLFSRLGFTLRFICFIFLLVVSIHIVVFGFLRLAVQLGWFDSDGQLSAFLVLVMICSCVVVGLLITTVLYRLILVPMQNLIAAIQEVGRGNFSVRLVSDDRNEVGFLMTAFNKMIESLGELNTLRDDFVANVSHEFKTPLAAIQGCATLLQDDNLSPGERRQYTDIIYNSAKRLSVLSTNILELSRLDHGEVEVRKSRFALDEQLRQALLVLQGDWQSKDIDLNLELAEVEYWGSEDLLMQVWLNLLGNAIKFSNAKGRVSVCLEKLSGAVVVTVQDEGIGIDKEAQRHIFDKFYQADTTHKTEGNGLGLAMVKRILELLGGDIEVRSELGKGATFVVYLPLEPIPA